MLGKLAWPAHDQMRGVDGSESGVTKSGEFPPSLIPSLMILPPVRKPYSSL
jgi:hypothetical protein